ncbi:MAG: amidase domain-containing protein [Firmicutes bacterium]|nr:amidase domain-containing protein [Bacillota bacterium]
MVNNRNYLQYNREAAVNYATKWALVRNPKFYDYSKIGGDCANFASQVLLAGGASMNYDPVQGWYYIDPNQKSPSWTGVNFLYSFLVTNQTKGPFGINTNSDGVASGDLIQLSYDEGPSFNHTLIITHLEPNNSLNGIYVSAHSIDRYNANLVKTYSWKQIRFIHILGSF